jgi:hypothetical protein
MKGSTRWYDADQLRRISEVTIAHYDRLAILVQCPAEAGLIGILHLTVRQGVHRENPRTGAGSQCRRADVSELPKLRREDDQMVFGDAGYASDEYKRGARALGIVWRVQDKAKLKGSRGAALSGSQKKRNRRNSGIRGRVEPCSGSSSGSSATPRCATAGWRSTCMLCVAGW